MAKLPLIFTGSLLSLLVGIACTQNSSDTPAPSNQTPGADSGTPDSSTPDGGTPDGSVTPPSGEGAITSCPNATLFSGNPYFDGDLDGYNPAGQEKLADPPLPNRYLAAAGATVFYGNDVDVWRTDGTKVVRVAGDPAAAESEYKPTGNCADVRFIEIRGVAALPNGNALVIDAKGGGIVELKTPTATCTAGVFAGNPNDTLESAITGEVANEGDVDGAGNIAKFHGITHITTDKDGNAYVIDEGNHKVKKIGNDAAHTVDTLYTYSTADLPVLLGMTVIGGKLYVSGANVTDDFLWEIDIAGKTQKPLYKGRGIYPDIDPSALAVIVSLQNDGSSIIAASNKGYLYKVDLTGHVVANLAGIGPFADYPEGIDLTKPVPKDQLPLRTIGTNEGTIALSGKTVYWGGKNAVGFHVWSVNCQ